MKLKERIAATEKAVADIDKGRDPEERVELAETAIYMLGELLGALPQPKRRAKP